MRSKLKRSIVGIAKRSRLLTDVANLISQHTVTQTSDKDTYGYLRERFLNNGKGKDVNEAIRGELVKRFEGIDHGVPIASTPTDGLFLAEMLLSMEAEGDIIECGCYAGGSSAKLSLVARLLGRQLVIFDSFEGLPLADGYSLRDHHCRRDDGWVTDWTQGRYAARLDEVRSNIERHGDISVCRFVKGWFKDTLNSSEVPARVSFAFTDVDLASSARECFTALWPRVSNGGIYVTHDTAYIKVLQELYNPTLWKEEFRSIPPILFGAGFGLCNDSPHIGYMVKGESLSPEYVKNLTIDK